MAGSFSNYLENAVLDHVLKVAALTVPTNLYVALYTVAPTDAGGGTEVTGGSYARKVANAWTTASGGAAENSAAITFATATAGWGTVVAFAVFDAITAGNMLFHGTLAANKTVLTDDAVEFAIGAIDVTLD